MKIMKEFESQQFRDELAKTLKKAPKEERRGILDKVREAEARVHNEKMIHMNNFWIKFLEANREVNINDEEQKGYQTQTYSQKRSGQTWREYYVTLDSTASELGIDIEEIKRLCTRLRELKFLEAELLRKTSDGNSELIQVNNERSEINDRLAPMLEVIADRLLEIGYSWYDIAA